MDNVMLIAGIVVLAAVVLQSLLLIANSLRQSVYRKQQHQVSLDLLNTKIETQRILHHNAKESLEAWKGHRKFVVEKTVTEVQGITSVYLVPHDGRKLPLFLPGQHLTFKFDIPDEDRPVNRCYTLSEGPNPNHYRITVKQVLPPRDTDLPPGKSSTYINNVVATGDIIDVKAPKGDFYIDMSKHHPVVFIGGGVGITPFTSMFTELAAQDFQREVWLFYGVRNANEHAFRDLLDEMADQYENFHLHVAYSDVEPDAMPDSDRYHRGHCGVELMSAYLPSNNYEFYMCGPPPMMNAVAPALLEWGVPKNKIRFEAFGPASIKGFGPEKPAATAVAAEASPASVNFSKSGKSIAWDTQHDSLLELGTANGVRMDSGCCAGECLTCEVALVSGNVLYIKEPSEPPDVGSCLPCICIPNGDVEIDA